MNFSKWYKQIEESIGLITDPFEAMQELNLVDFAGKVLDTDSLNNAYRKMQILHHPDRLGSEEKSKRINAAKEVLLNYVGRTLPTELGTKPEPAYSSSYTQSSYSSPEPRDRKHYTENDVSTWSENVVSKNHLQFVVRELLRWLPMTAVFGGFNAPIGSKIKTEKLSKKGKNVSPDDILRLVKSAMVADGANFPSDIYHMDLNDKWGEAWVTYKGQKGYRSLSFNLVKAPIKKQPGVGMSIPEVETYLLLNDPDLRRLGNGYLGYPEHNNGRTIIGVMIKLQPKVMNIVKRYRTQMYGASKVEEIKLTDGAHYGKITKEYLDKVILAVQRRRGQSDTEA